MRAIGGLIVLVLAAPLGGCFGLTAQKTVPEWAMASHPQAAEQPRQRVARAPVQRRVAQDRGGSLEMPTNSGNVAMSTDSERAAARAAAPAPRAAPTNFSPEWYAQEKAADEQLRRRMNICNGC